MLITNTLMQKIPDGEVEFSPFSIIDDFGKVFFWGGQVFRAINIESVNNVKMMFTSGLIPHLIEKGLFVDSRMTDYELEGYGLVIQHELANVVTYPYEWSFSMLKKAGLMVLDLNKNASKYGYQTKDIHPYNVLFFGLTPKFIDLGSFVLISKTSIKYLYTFEEFSRCYFFPLKVWSLGDSYTARRFIQRWKLMAPIDSYVSYRLGGRIGLLKKQFFNLWKSIYLLQRVRLVYGDLLSVRYQKWSSIFKIINWLGFPLCISKINSLEKRLGNLMPLKSYSEWGSYHESLYLYDNKPVLSERLQKIVEIIIKLNPATVTDIAGNQGVLSQVIAGLDGVDQVTCLDYDDEAIDLGYIRVLNSNLPNKNLHFAVINPFYSETNKFESSPDSRFKSDLVLALALTHHLALTQSYSLSYIFTAISKYTRKNVAIEFMPLGLFDSIAQKGNPPPDWYTEEWFTREFEKEFKLIDVVKLEINRILFIGELINV